MRATTQHGFARWAFVGLACLYALTIGRGFYSSDGEVMFQTTAALVEHHTLRLASDPGLPQIVAGQGGAFYSKYDPGLSLLAVPFYVVGDRLAAINHAHRYGLAALCVLLLPVLAAAGAVALSAGWIADTRGGAVAGMALLAAGLASPLWVYARELFAEALLACALTAAVLMAHGAGRSRRRLVGAGAVFGVGLATRAAFGLYALPLAVLIAWKEKQEQKRTADDTEKKESSTGEKQLPVEVSRPTGQTPRAFASFMPLPFSVFSAPSAVSCIAFFAGMLPGAALLLAHNVLRFGDPLRFGYAGEEFTARWWEGAPGLLISPGRGVLIYAPVLMLCVLLWPRFRRVFPALGIFLALAWAAALIVYGAWWAWGGGWCWGPRFLVPLLPLSVLSLSVLPAGRSWRAAALLLIAVGIAVQVPGVFTDVTPHFAAVDAAGGSVDWSVRDAAWMDAVVRFSHGKTEPLAMFHLRDFGLPLTWVYGVPALLVIGLSMSAWQMRRRVECATI